MKDSLKIIVAVFVLNFQYLLASAQQNLVPNPSFEQFSSCPNSWASFNGNVLNWTGLPWGTPEEYDTCGNAFQFGVPQNPYGYQIAKDGNSYAGIGFEFGVTTGDYREYLQVKLSDTLISNKKYLVSFFVSKADSACLVNTKIGAYLSDTDNLNTFPNGVIDALPQVISPNGYYLQDNLNWLEISDTIIAQGQEEFITIGHFEGDSTADTLRIFHATPSQILALGNNTEWTAYYFIDDVKVICIDCTLNTPETINNDYNTIIYPNPAVNSFTLKLNKPFLKIELINSNGTSIKTFRNSDCDVSNIEQGFYLIKITFLNQQIIYQKILITKD